MGCGHFWRAWVTLCLWMVSVGASHAAANEAPIPIEAFYGMESIDRVVLSPSGRKLALLTSEAGPRRALIVIDLEDGNKSHAVVNLHDGDVLGFEWVNDDRLVYTVVDLHSGARQQRYSRGLFSVRSDGSEPRVLIKVQHGQDHRAADLALAPNHYLMMVPEAGGDEIIIGRAEYDGAGDLRAVHPMRLNVVTREVVSLARGAPPHSHYWVFDPSGAPRAAVSLRDGRSRVHWRGPGEEAWKQISDSPYLDPDFSPFAVDGKGQLFVQMIDRATGYNVLKRFDFSMGRPEDKPLVSVQGFDFDGRVIVDPGQGGGAVGLRLVTDAVTSVWFDPQMKKLQETVDNKLPGRVNRISCRRCHTNDMVALVYSWSDREPGEYWLYRPAKESWVSVGRIRPGIDPARMGTLDLHRIRARDGLELPVWVTLPAARAPDKPRPAVVLVHPGPWRRGVEWSWGADRQFLASRGYVVIEPEFRGSTGYGDRHFRAGWKQWGAAMQDDLVDAVDWAASKGWIDPQRVCIMGDGYGGYAALMSLVRHPQRYRCASSWNAPTLLRSLFDESEGFSVSRESRGFTLPQLVGDPTTETELLDAASPALHADRIKAPILLGHGGFPSDQPRLMRKALEDAGREYEWIHLPTETFEIYSRRNAVDYVRRIEQFLDRHLR